MGIFDRSEPTLHISIARMATQLKISFRSGRIASKVNFSYISISMWDIKEPENASVHREEIFFSFGLGKFLSYKGKFIVYYKNWQNNFS